MSKIAFEPVAEKFSGGSVSLPGGEFFDVGKAVKDGGGKITLDPAAKGEQGITDGRIADALSSFPGVKLAPAGRTANADKKGDD